MILPSLLGPIDDDAPRVLSVCSGVGGKDLGFYRGGFRTVGLCEFDPWRRRVLARHWPGVPIHEDLEALADWAERDPEAVRGWLGGQPDVLIGGTPCQDLSSAGRRAGLAGERSGLFFAFMRLRHALGIEWTVWENVRGALTSNGGVDFMAVVGAFVGATLTVPAAGVGGAGVAAGPRGGCVWRLLNAQWFGVPQRRRRVFVVGRLGGECPPQVLLERVRGRRHPEEGGAARQVAPWATAVRARGAGGPGLADRNGGGGRGDDGGAGPVGHGFGGDGVAGTIGASAGGGRGHDARPDRGGGIVDVAPTLAKQGVGTGQFLGSDAGIIAATLTGGGHPGSAPPGGAAGARAGGAPDGVSAGGGEPGRSEGRRVESAAGEGGSAADDIAGGVAPVDADGVRAVDGLAGRVDGDVSGGPIAFRSSGLDSPRDDGQAPTVGGHKNAQGVGGADVMVATFVKRRGAGAEDASPESWGESDVSRTVTADSHRQDTPPALVARTLSHLSNGGANEDSAATLDRSYGAGQILQPAAPIELELCAVDPQPDGRRYAACGDGVAAPQAHWIALRLRSVMEGKDPDGNA